MKLRTLLGKNQLLLKNGFQIGYQASMWVKGLQHCRRSIWRSEKIPYVSLPAARLSIVKCESWIRMSDFFFTPPTLTSGSFALLHPLELQGCIAFNLRVLNKECDITFHVFHNCSKVPSFNSTYLVRVLYLRILLRFWGNCLTCYPCGLLAITLQWLLFENQQSPVYVVNYHILRC